MVTVPLFPREFTVLPFSDHSDKPWHWHSAKAGKGESAGKKGKGQSKKSTGKKSWPFRQ